jgi:hypothetical protein
MFNRLAFLAAIVVTATAFGIIIGRIGEMS